MADTSDPLEILDAIDRERGDSSIGMIQANQVQRLRDEIVALRDELATMKDAYDGLANSIRPAVAESVRVAQVRIRDEALEEAARVCEGGYTTGSTASRLKAVAAAIRKLKDKTG